MFWITFLLGVGGEIAYKDTYLQVSEMKKFLDYFSNCK